MRAYKGFNKDLVCTMGKGQYQYEVGKTYKEDVAKCANTGFHCVDIRRHKVICDFDCTAYDTAFATPIGTGGEIIGQGENVTIKCVPNTNLIYPVTEIKAVKYQFKKGTTDIETKVIYP